MPSQPLSASRQAVKDYTSKGLTPREIARLLNISTQRVYHHLKKLGMEPAQSDNESSVA